MYLSVLAFVSLSTILRLFHDGVWTWQGCYCPIDRSVLLLKCDAPRVRHDTRTHYLDFEPTSYSSEFNAECLTMGASSIFSSPGPEAHVGLCRNKASVRRASPVRQVRRLTMSANQKPRFKTILHLIGRILWRSSDFIYQRIFKRLGCRFILMISRTNSKTGHVGQSEAEIQP